MFDGPGYDALKTPSYSILLWGQLILSVFSAVILFSLLVFLLMPSGVFLLVMFGGGFVNIVYMIVFVVACSALLAERSRRTTIVVTGVHNEL